MTTDRLFHDLPEQEVITEGWREHYAPLALAARQTSWGMQDHERRVLGLCQQLELLETQADMMQSEMVCYDERIEELEKQLKAKQLECGRYKKKIEKLEAAQKAKKEAE